VKVHVCVCVRVCVLKCLHMCVCVCVVFVCGCVCVCVCKPVPPVADAKDACSRINTCAPFFVSGYIGMYEGGLPVHYFCEEQTRHVPVFSAPQPPAPPMCMKCINA